MGPTLFVMMVFVPVSQNIKVTRTEVVDQNVYSIVNVQETELALGLSV